MDLGRREGLCNTVTWRRYAPPNAARRCNTTRYNAPGRPPKHNALDVRAIPAWVWQQALHMCLRIYGSHPPASVHTRLCHATAASHRLRRGSGREARSQIMHVCSPTD